MKPIANYNNIEASNGEFSRPAPGGYIVKITKAEDVANNPQTGKGDYLKIEYDFPTGELKDYYKQLFEQFGFWGGNFIRSYKEKALGMFKAFTNALEESNKHVNYVWDFDETKLVGKFIGVVLGEEEYQKNDGTIATRLYVASTVSADKIKSGNFKVPALKKLKTSGGDSAGYGAGVPMPEPPPLTDEDYPFA